jgi:glycosyltransferase involved in cell wall biosynthesis
MVSISIIIPVFNVEQYVQRCIESVLAQDNMFASVECIIVDDCTPDRSMEVVRQIVASYRGPIKIEMLKHEVNRGLSAARNTGLMFAKGDYVLFIDSDDFLMPDSVQYFLENLKRNPDVDIVMGNVKTCKDGEMLIKHIKSPWLIDDSDIFFRRMLHHQIYLYAWNKLIKKDLLLDNKILFEEGILFEDQCWSYQLFSHISSVLLLPRVTYIYEYNPNSIVNTTQTIEKADKVIWSYTVSINKMLDTPPVPQKYNRNITVDYLLFMTNFLMNGVDVLSKFKISKDIKQGFLSVRMRLLLRSLSYGRVLLFLFFLLLFPPLSYLQKIRIFRHHYYDIESVVNMICHKTDFLHHK